jgi:hypothetical protein
MKDNVEIMFSHLKNHEQGRRQASGKWEEDEMHQINNSV